MMLDVVGGTYIEICREPESHDIRGSGLRSAEWLGSDLGCFYTCATPTVASAVQSLLRSDRVNAIGIERQPSFLYETPLSKPAFNPPDDRVRVSVQSRACLIFGMVEATPTVEAQIAVVDPQGSVSLSTLSEIDAEELHIVLNRAELAAVTQNQDPADAVDELQTATSAASIAVKCGPYGGYTYVSGELAPFAAYRTTEVWPIGSGDVFSASYAKSVVAGLSPESAADGASRDTAAYVSRSSSAQQVRALGLVSVDVMSDPPIVYVASSFESAAQRWEMRTATWALEDLDVRTFCPVRDVGPAADREATEIAEADADGLRKSDAVLLLADTDRSGPFVEAGIALERQIPVTVLSSGKRHNSYTMLRGLGASIRDDLSSAVYDAAWNAIERQVAP